LSFKSLIDEIENNLYKILEDMSISDISFTVEPAKPGFGDVSSNIAFLLAKPLKKNPKEIANVISEKYRKFQNMLVSVVEPHPSGYLNFYADWEKLSQLILSEADLDEFGSINFGNDLSIVVEHTSVNPNKALHIGHIRNIVLGDTVARILKKSNYKVHVRNYVDDSGLQVADIIVGFKHLGFGTGYSSLLYLKRLPANELKIDRGFVRDLVHDGDDAAIISAIVALGQALNLRIVAEGVETRQQQDFLTDLGCNSLQGFLLGHPLPAKQFMQAIEAAA
jgi:arginyl-tRNA synthetase